MKKHVLNILAIVLLITVGTLLIYWKKGIAPFGRASLAWGDMHQTTIPLLYHIYDVFCGEKSPFFSWNVGTGINLSGIVSEFSLLSPLNLFMLVIARENITDFVGILLIIKMAYMAISMYIFISWRYKITDFYRIVLAIEYGYSSCVLIHYQIGFMLDIAFFLPFLMIGVYQLLDEGKTKIYIVFLSLCLIINIYVGVMLLFFILIMSGSYLHFKVDNEVKSRRVIELMCATVIGLLLGAVIWLPALLSILNSGRINNSGKAGGLEVYLEAVCSTDFAVYGRSFLLVNMGLLITIILCSYSKLKKEKYHLILIVLMLLATIIPGTELLWHMGSRQSWPVRFIFIVTFVMIDCCADVLSEIKVEGKKMVRYLVSFFLALTMVFSISQKIIYIQDEQLLLFVWVSTLSCVVLYYLAIRKGKKNREIFLCFIITMELFTNGMIWLSPYSMVFPTENEYLSACKAIETKDIGVESDNLSRWKDKNNLLNSNYALVADTYSIANYVHVIPRELQETFNNLGYSVVWTRLLDSGGTIFTDNMLGMKYLLTDEYEDERLYTFNTEIDDGNVRIYKYNCELPTFIEMSKDIVFYNNYYEYQNDIFSDMTGIQDKLIEENSCIDKNGNAQIAVQKQKILYFYSDSKDNVKIYINGRGLEIPSLYNRENEIYPAPYNNTLICLGIYADEKIDVRLEPENQNYDFNKVHIGELNMDVYKEGIRVISENNLSEDIIFGKDKLQFSHVKKREDYLFIPIAYDEGWKCTINQNSVDTVSLMGFLGVPLLDGTNDIKLQFVPKGTYLGITITIIGVILWWIYSMFFSNNLKYETKAYLYIYRCVLAIFLVLVYVVPLLILCGRIVRRIFILL